MTDQGSYHVSSFSASMQAEIRRLDAQVDLFWHSELALMREFGMRDGIDYLDCGCGPGRLIQLVKSTFPATRCNGVEMDPILIEAAQAKMRSAGLDCRITQGTAERPNLTEGSFDFISMRLVLEHVPDPVLALRSLGRLLRPGGRLLIISNDFEYHTRTWPPVPELAALYDAYRTARRQDGGDPTIGRRVPVLLKRAGFKLIDQRAEVAHSTILGDEAFLKAEGVGIPAELVSRGFLAQEVFESMIRNWKEMLATPDHVITRQLNVAIGEHPANVEELEESQDGSATGIQVASTASAPAATAPFRAPAGDVESQIAELWCRVMGVDRVGVDRNFFDLGGDSLMLQEVHAGLREMGFNVQITTLFQFPTVETLAEHLTGTGVRPAGGTTGTGVPASAPEAHAGPGTDDDVHALARRRREALARKKPSGNK